MQVRIAVILLSLSLFCVALAGCAMGPSDRGEGDCDAWSLVQDAVAYFETRTHPDGGLVYRLGTDADPRTTAWVLIAVGLAERTGQVAPFDGRVHSAWLIERLPTMLQEGTGVDSVANNLSLARAALQSWGRMAAGVELQDPDHPEVRSLADAWQVRFDEGSGVYGGRLNEHVFGAFAARVFENNLTRLQAMGHALGEFDTQGEQASAYENDAWYAGYARALLGPEPVDASLATQLDAILSSRQNDSGAFIPFEHADRPDASTTAAALLAWQASGRNLEDPGVVRAVDWLCAVQRDDGAIPFSPELNILHVKTTAEVVIALALFLEPIPWPEPPPGHP